MKVFTVYRYDYNRQVREPIGTVLERRKGDRGNDIKGLLKLAQKIIFQIVVGFTHRHLPRIRGRFNGLGGAANPALSVSEVLSDFQRP